MRKQKKKFLNFKLFSLICWFLIVLDRSNLIWWAIGVAVLVLGFLALRTIVRPWIYDVMIVRMTETWYREFLNRVPRGSRVLVRLFGRVKRMSHIIDFVFFFRMLVLERVLH